MPPQTRETSQIAAWQLTGITRPELGNQSSGFGNSFSASPLEQAPGAGQAQFNTPNSTPSNSLSDASDGMCSANHRGHQHRSPLAPTFLLPTTCIALELVSQACDRDGAKGKLAFDGEGCNRRKTTRPRPGTDPEQGKLEAAASQGH